MGGAVKKSLWLAALWFGVLASAIGVVHSTHQSRSLTAQLVQMQKAQDELRFERERLLIERGAFSAYSRIEQAAREELDMRMPTEDERILVDASGK
ncbi:cell division protein FtsL [Biformimicrobium ophioploci]|uniref:Cell division protein FtsL n=1 Tax=Biformimicrobium ophioploci TaxID=3036711 RepID=A0ABQ6LX69_9GAMM|nr:cell division protein FtsL [Microbulbifer sp. NKW57]GMG86641.1 hypothetical protein MNKW57_09620 [Microbulbifer sp. NKW57]